ncbi:hypothetical protein [Ruegeria arenilitoris]|nr:hypothetical protein [Ruegeria arenilitoris]
MRLLATYADADVVVVKTVITGGIEDAGAAHTIIWGFLLTLLLEFC